MNKNIWAKTILTTYRYLERIADAIDNMVERSGLNSRDMSGANFSFNNILSLSDRMIALSQRKVKLINIKILTENSLQKCGELYAGILISKYVEGRKNAEIAEENGLPYRTYFRRLAEAETRFEYFMEKQGFTSEKLEAYLSSERWIMEVKNRLCLLRSEQEFDVPAERLDRLAVS